MAGTARCVRGDLGSTLGLTCYEKDFEQKSGPSILRGASGTDLALNIGPPLTRGFSFPRIFMETTMNWTTPAYTDLRFGFEITMYIATR